MDSILEALKAGRILLSDGAMGTALQQRGLAPGDNPERWNLDHPEAVEQISADYIAAGSDLIETNSFGGTRYKQKHYGLADRITELNRRAAEIARRAAGDDHFVAGSVGPTGVLLEPLGPARETEVTEAFAEQIAALAAGGADVICIETMMALEEARAALRAAKDVCDLPVIVTFTFEKGVRGDYRTLMGVSCAQVARELGEANILGSNCGGGMEQMIEVCREFRSATDKYLMMQPNAGLPVIEQDRTVFKATPREMAEKLGQLLEAGANIVGGCCGTTADHIAAMRSFLDR
ncbi:MAG: homocysteine S-methyltransferase family protein [Sedimentisphaerales bacterium]|nr:homocysteine S-methyltransferase family protein [Sedimentisphaerales bacterium]